MKLFFTLILLTFNYSITNSSTIKEFCFDEKEILINEKELLGEEVVRYIFKNSEYDHLTEFVIAQCKFESYNFRSNLYKNTNNFTGMGISYKRIQYKSGINKKGEKGRATAIYNSDYQCAIDLLEWYKTHGNYFCNVYNSKDFVLKLKNKKYFGANYKVYLNGVNSYLNDKDDFAYWLD